MAGKGTNHCPNRKEIQKKGKGTLYCEVKNGRKVSFRDGRCQADDCSLK